MASDTLSTLIGKVQQRVGTLPDYFLIQDWVVNKYRDIGRRIPWTWRRRQAQMIFYAPINTGTCTINRGDNQVTFSGAIMTSDLVGRQLRVAGNNTRIATITDMLDSTHATIDLAWGDASVVALGFEIYQAYITMPDDFDAFLSVVDLQRNFQLDFWGHTAEELDRTDPRRTYGGSIAYWVVLKDFASASVGPVAGVIQALGSGSAPLSGGQYTGAANATMIVTILSATTFQWKKDSGAFTGPVTMDSGGNAQGLQDGATIAFPSSGTYVSGDVFSIACSASAAPGSPRYECWPHIKVDEIRTVLYLATLPDLTEEGAVLPAYVRGDLVLEMCLAEAARWHHPDNKYYDLKLAMIHDTRAETMLLDLEREDGARESTDIAYTDWTQLPVYDSGYLAGHDIGYELNVLN